MLVLSRRESETVLFPKLGITIEVSRVKGKMVRLGIDAPDEIRVIRGELEDTADLEVKPKQPQRPSAGDNKLDRIQKCLNATNLAIHLAQNQLQQQLTGHAEEALGTALECLDELEKALIFDEPTPIGAGFFGAEHDSNAVVHEATSGYRIESKKLAVVMNQGCDTTDLNANLATMGYRILNLKNGNDLIEFLKSNRQPQLVVMIQPRPEDEPADHSPLIQSTLRLFGVGSLQRGRRDYLLNKSQLTCWFDNADDESTLQMNLTS